MNQMRQKLPKLKAIDFENLYLGLQWLKHRQQNAIIELNLNTNQFAYSSKGDQNYEKQRLRECDHFNKLYKSID